MLHIRLEGLDRVDRIWLALSASLFAIAMIYLAPKILNNSDGLDFRLLWLAGKMWLSGVSPYSSEFDLEYLKVFGQGPNTHFWVYPPYWIFISVPLALAPFKAALLLWNILNLLLLLFACFIIAKQLQPRLNKPALPLFFLVATLASFMQSTPFAIALGQTSIIIFFGAVLFQKGYIDKQSIPLIAGMVLLMLKPNIGIIAAALLIQQNWSWRALSIAGGICGFGLAAAFLTAGVEDTITGFGENLSRYVSSGYSANNPENLTGITQLFDIAGVNAPSTTILIISALGIVSLANYFVHERRDVCLFLFATIVFVVPLHSYDFILTVALIPLFAFRSKLSLALAVIGFVLVFRPGNLAAVSGLSNIDGQMFKGSFLASLGALAFFTASIENTRPLFRTQKSDI